MHSTSSPRTRKTQGTIAYRLVRMMIRLLLWLFYRRIDVVGRERIPPEGGAIDALRAGGVVLIFPEGRTQPQPILLPLRTGAARLALGLERAAGGPHPVTLLPVGIVFHDPGIFRSASVQLTIGAPVATADVFVPNRERPEEAVRVITARLTKSIGERIVEAEDHYTLGLLAVLERAWWEESARRGEPGPASDKIAEQALAWKR